MQTTKTAPIAINVRQPVGTNHFQFRDHQPFRGGCDGNGDGREGTGGGVGSIASLCRPTKSKSSNLLLRFALFNFLGKSPRKAEMNPNTASTAPV